MPHSAARRDPRGSTRLTVAVRDLRTGEAFDLDAEARNAMDVYNHPFAYAGARSAYA